MSAARWVLPSLPGCARRLACVWRSLPGQLLALLLAALVLAHLIAAGVMAVEEGVRVHPLSVRAISHQVAAAWRVAQVPAPAGDKHALLQALDAPDAHFVRTARAPVVALDAQNQETAVVAAIGQSLGLADRVPVYAALRPARAADVPRAPAAPGGLRQTVEDGSAWVLDIAVPLPDGAWLHSQHWPAMMHPHWDRVLQFSLWVSALACMLIAILFGRSVMRPLNALAQAAARISRGDTLAPLVEQGPHGVRGITRAFNLMQARVQRFMRDRTQMLAAIGHDLRTPLTSLRIRAELIEDAAVRDAMRATIDEVVAMAEETLCFARDDAVDAASANVDLHALVDEVVAHARVAHKPVAWTPGRAPLVWRCRPLHIKRILGNLLDNAVRYGKAAVHIEADATQLRVVVEDDGPGIAPDQLERVFEPFTRADDARTLNGKNTGLGLAIARAFARAHGGDIALHNRAGGGLCAVLTLPR